MDIDEYIKLHRRGVGRAWPFPRQLALLNHALARWPGNTQLWNLLAELHLGSPRSWEAERSLAEFARAPLQNSCRDDAEAWATFGKLLEVRDDFRRAERYYRTALDIDPSYGWALGRLSRLLRQRYERYQEARQLAERHVGVEPDRAWPWFNLGFIDHHGLNNPNSARSSYERALELDPEFVAAWQNLASLLTFQLSLPAEAEAAFQRAFDLDPCSAWTFNQFAIHLREWSERDEECESAFRRAMELDGREWGNWLGLGVFYEKRGRMIDARRCLEEAGRLGAPAPEISYRLAKLAAAKPKLQLVTGKLATRSTRNSE